MNRLVISSSRLKASSALAFQPWASTSTLLIRSSTTRALPTLRHSSILPTTRTLSTTPSYNKKKDKSPSKSASRSGPSSSTPSSSSSSSSEDAGHPSPNPEDPHNFADVASRFTALADRFKSELKQTRAGKYNPDALGALAVPTGGGETYPLRELAQVVPRSGGRTLSLLVNDKAFVKPVMSAIEGSKNFNQQPQPDPENELELTMKVEMERPEEVSKRLKEICHRWRERVRDVKTKRDKVITGWGKLNVVTTDVKHKLSTELTNLMKKELQEVDKAETQAINQVGRGR